MFRRNNHIDSKDFEKIVNEYSNILFRLAFYRLGTVSEARDVVQEVFIGLFKNISKNGQILNLKYYLLQSVRNACNNWITRTRDESISISVDEDCLSISDDPAEVVIARDKLVLIQKLLCQLPEEQSEVIQLKLIEDLKFHEIAEIVNLPVPTIKSRFRYGLDKLRSIIQNKNYYNELF